VSTKTCPNCENAVPAVANLCKHCAHDFNTPVVQPRSPWIPLGALALGTGLVAVWAFSTMRDAHKGSTVFLDEETKRVVVIETYPDRREATQVPFEDVAGLEYVKNGTPHPFEFALVSKNDERFVVSAGEASLDPKVKQYEQALGKTAVVKGDIDVSKLAE
jgi:hypothetical protein